MNTQHDTIAAIATPYGEGGIAVIRISGPDAIAVARAVWRRANGGECPPLESHRVYHGHITDPHSDTIIDEGLLIFFAKNRSYTGDDTVELNCHGGPFVARRVLEATIAAGASHAGPGEFTRRAFLAGRMDLAQAEAVADLIASSSDRELQNARLQLDGNLSDKVNDVAARVTEALAEVESRIDFPEEDDIGALPFERLEELMNSSRRDLEKLAEGYTEGRILKQGYRLTFIGRPNVGKSSLLNRLLGAERAIVTAQAGTTRDTIEERVVWRGMPFLLVDTAGMRHAAEGSPEYIATRISRERAREHSIDPAGGVLLVMLDRSEPLTEEDIEVLDMALETPHILVLNKCDLNRKFTSPDLPEKWRDEKPVMISALTGEGISNLIEAVIGLRSQGGSKTGGEGYLLSSARHFAAVKRSVEAIERADDAIKRNLPHEIIALEIRLAREALDEIVGRHSVENILDIIFSRFCIGK